MRTLARYALINCIAAALLAGCGVLPLSLSKGQDDTQPPIAAPGAMSRALSSSYQVLYTFHRARRHGIFPSGPLTNVNGTLYGATLAGGEGCAFFRKGCGTVYRISAGIEKIVYSTSVNESPVGALLNVAGTLYGTTGGYIASYGSVYGTVYSVTTTGTYTLLYKFTGGSDGALPTGSLIDVGGVLYGTTREGGGLGCNLSHSAGCGTIYSITTSGSEKVLYRFKGRSDGGYPNAGLIDVHGTLYGTTQFGGSGCRCGTVFSVTTSGRKKVLHSFRSGSDGSDPSGGLVNVKGTLYGTTLTGGSSCGFSGEGCGTVYSITTSGMEKVLYSFRGGDSDGEHPRSQLVNVNGMLYGTTSQGGGSSVCSYGYGPYGCGTVYSVSTSGVETMLHSFASDPDGATPTAALTEMNGTLYGVTPTGGARCPQNLDDPGCGTVFSLQP